MPPSRLKCPICKDVLLGDGMLDSNLVAHPCAQCGGQWIAPKDYWKWLEGRKVVTPDPPPADNPIDLPVKQTDTPKFCPDCGRFLGRHKVGHGVAFSIDRCGTCGGFWLDANEWQVLQSRHIHERLHFVASDAWQADVAREEREKGHEQIVLGKVGAEDLEKIKGIKAWIDGHAHKAELYAFLLDKEKKER
jgi:Zn-finger nucleic acid-binding protein